MPQKETKVYVLSNTAADYIKKAKDLEKDLNDNFFIEGSESNETAIVFVISRAKIPAGSIKSPLV